MLHRLLLAIALSLTSISGGSAQDIPKAWYDPEFARAPIISLQDALREEKSFLQADNPGYRMKGDARVCAALQAVHLPCDYNTRGTLAMFLAVNGKGLFPAAGGTNRDAAQSRALDLKLGLSPGLDDGFVGEPRQNEMLAAAVRKNAVLFKKGNLTAQAVRNDWR